MTSPTSSLSTTQPEPSLDSLGSQPCSPSSCCGACQSESATAATTAVSNESASEPSKSDFSASTPNGLAYLTLMVHPDKRGNVRETYRASWFPTIPPVKQLVRSESKPRTLRGMHLHRKQWDIWHFVEGLALIRLYDHATGENRWLTGSPNYVLAIPPGISHGFWTDSGATLMYALTEEYDGSDEFGWYPFDGITKDDLVGTPGWYARKWPADPSDMNISLRDLGAARLAEFRA